MPTIITVDAHHASRLQLRAALPSDWVVLEAFDGLRGLDLIRRHKTLLDLVIIDLNLPCLDGLLVCALIRTIAPTLPILVVTERMQDAPTLAALNCLPPVAKPLIDEDTASTIQDALTQAMVPPPDSPLLRFVQQQAAEAERQARLQYAPLRLVVFGTTPTTRAGLVQYVAAARPGAQIVSIGQLDMLAPTMTLHHTHILVTDTADYTAAVAIARALDVPLLLLVGRLDQARDALTDGHSHIMLLDDTPQTITRLTLALAQIQRGERVVPDVTNPHVTWPLIPDEPLPGLTPRETEQVLLDLHGWTTVAIARRFCVELDTVTTYWKRIYHKLGCNRMEVRAWAATALQRPDPQALPCTFPDA